MSYANNNGIKIHFEVEGQGPPLVLQHGFNASLETWRSYGYVKELKDGYTLILIDARGHGESDKPHDPAAYDFKPQVGDVVAVLDDLKIEKAHFWGYSMGANIGFYIPVYAPERFTSLILGGWAFARPGHEKEDHKSMSDVHDDIRQAIRENPEHPMESYLAIIEKKAGRLPPAVRAENLKRDGYALAAIAQAHSHPSGPEPEEIIKMVKHSCLMYAGENDPVCEAVKQRAAEIPAATFFQAPRLGHLGAFTHSALVLPHVKEFLANAKG